MLPSSTASTYGFALVDTPPTTPIPTLSVRVFEPSSSEANMVPYLAAIHANCITADHTIMSFLPPIDQEKLLQLWRDVIAEVRARQRLMVLLFDESPGQQPPASLMGVATLKTPESETGPFRGWVKNVLVSPRFRRRGGGRALMGKVEEEAAKRGRNLLMIDTESNKGAEELYRKLGYIEVGRIPNYSLKPYGGMSDETFFYKQLAC